MIVIQYTPGHMQVRMPTDDDDELGLGEDMAMADGAPPPAPSTNIGSSGAVAEIVMGDDSVGDVELPPGRGNKGALAD